MTDLPRVWRVASDVVIVGLAAVVALALYRQRDGRPVSLSDADWQLVSSGAHQLGDSNAQLTLLEFLDYRCPACRTAEGVLAGIERSFPSRIRRLVRFVPLTRDPDVVDSVALLALCADRQGRLAPMHRLLFSRPMSAPTLAPDSLAIAVGIADREQFSACLRSADASAELMSDRSIAELMGVAALPTFVVDREWVSGVEPARLRELVLRHLR